jgi:APA family basic amino acid/polyamine antiporter
MSKPEVFVRSKSGLVRVMNAHDALIFNIVNISFFSASLFAFQLAPVIFPGGNVPIAFVLTILFTAPLYLAYALLATSYPRSGGDYVFLSRLINPALAFVATFSAWVFWQWWYQGIFPLQIYWQSVAPFFSKLAFYTGSSSLIGLSNAMTSPLPAMVFGVVLIAVALLFALPGLRFYVKVQRVMFVVALLAVGSILYTLLTTTPASFPISFNAFVASMTGQKQDWYNLVIQTAHSNGYSPSAFSWSDTIGIIPIAMMCMGYGFWSIMLMGEIKEAKLATLQVYAIYGSVVLSGLFFALVGFLMNNVGADFYGSLFYLYYNGNPLISQMTITPSYVGLAMIASQNIVLDTLLAVGSALNVFNLMILMFIVGSRVMFAQALDRILPQKLADLGRRFVTPVNAMVLYFVGSVAWMIPASIYPTLYYYFTAVVLGVLLAYVLVGFAALVFPYKGKAVYETMPFSKYKIGGLHLISLIGILNLIFCAFLVYFYSTIPALGLNSMTSLELVLAVYVLLGVYYYANRWYKKRTLGYDVELAFKEVPPE